MRPSPETHFQKVWTAGGSGSGSGERILEVTERGLAVQWRVFWNDGVFTTGERKEENGGDGEREKRVAILGLSLKPTNQERMTVLNL